jgi:ProP effector
MPGAPPDAEVRAVIELLTEMFPKAFFIYERRRRPLKLGIHLDVLAAMNGAITPVELNHALRCYTSNVGYLRACWLEAFRIDLEGEPAGEVSPQHAARAAARLAARQLRRAAQKATLAQPEPKRHGLAELKAMGRARGSCGARTPVIVDAGLTKRRGEIARTPHEPPEPTP